MAKMICDPLLTPVKVQEYCMRGQVENAAWLDYLGEAEAAQSGGDIPAAQIKLVDRLLAESLLGVWRVARVLVESAGQEWTVSCAAAVCDRWFTFGLSQGFTRERLETAVKAAQDGMNDYFDYLPVRLQRGQN